MSLSTCLLTSPCVPEPSSNVSVYLSVDSLCVGAQLECYFIYLPIERPVCGSPAKTPLYICLLMACVLNSSSKALSICPYMCLCWSLRVIIDLCRGPTELVEHFR